MRKKTFVTSGIVVVVLAVLIPLLVFRADGNKDTGPRNVPSNLRNGRELFNINCGTCHTLYAAGTDGNFGPNLDTQLAPNGPATSASTISSTKQRVLSAILNGFDTQTTKYRMPRGIVTGELADEIAQFVAAEAGRG